MELLTCRLQYNLDVWRAQEWYEKRLFCWRNLDCGDNDKQKCFEWCEIKFLSKTFRVCEIKSLNNIVLIVQASSVKPRLTKVKHFFFKHLFYDVTSDWWVQIICICFLI